MIVLLSGESLLLITQPNHAALARRVMEQWRAPDLSGHPRRDSILRAIEHHDDGWLDVDASPLLVNSTGQIADFILAPVEVRQGVWPRAVHSLADDPLAAALVAEHARYVYQAHRGKDDWTPFFSAMEQLRAKYAAAAGVSLEVVLADYAFLRIGDIISLVFCNRWTEGREDFGVNVRWLNDRVVVSPPGSFGGRTVPMSVRAREMPNRAFRDKADLVDAFARARDVMLSGEVVAA